MALLLAILSANMTHTYLVEKVHWLMFALAVASAATVTGKQRSHISVPMEVLRSKARARRVVSQA
jgi:hypothetical protein